MSYVNVSRWESKNAWKRALRGGEAADLRRAASAGEEREVAGVHDEAGVQVQTLWGDKTGQRGDTPWLALTSGLNEEIQNSWPLRANQQQQQVGRVCAPSKGDALTLVKVELLVGRAVPQTFDVHEVAVDIWIVQRAEGHVCKRRGGEWVWTDPPPLPCSASPPAVFCFLMGMDREGLFCMPVDTATWEAGTAIIAGAAAAGAAGVATAVFFTVFLGDSEEIGTLLSSYSFLFTVLLIWALQQTTATGHV